MAYTYDIKYKPTDKHGNADGLSRLPAGPDVAFDETMLETDSDIAHSVQEIFDGMPILPATFKKKSLVDPLLKQVMDCVQKNK